ncbi:MAG TPA: replication initiation factor domain-containing protein [Anaerolineae bacterium]|nr:replication initiation factor domain-containing protein [Anaerolineae bacterium]
MTDKTFLNDIHTIGSPSPSHNLLLNVPMVDWLTVTTFDHSHHNDWLEHQLSLSRLISSQLTPTASRGYEGLKFSPLSWSLLCGEQKSRSHFMSRSSGAGSHAVFKYHLPRLDSLRVTRIDLQITVQIPVDFDWLSFFDFMSASIKSHNPRIKTNLNTNSDYQLSTVYIGSRSSDRFIRFYAKEVTPSPDAIDQTSLRFFRFEVEYKGDRATNVSHALADGASIADFLLGELDRWPELYPPLYDFLLSHLSGDATSASAPSEVVETSKSYAWFVRSVVPFLKRMISDNDYGFQIASHLAAILSDSGYSDAYDRLAPNYVPPQPRSTSRYPSPHAPAQPLQPRPNYHQITTN